MKGKNKRSDSIPDDGGKKNIFGNSEMKPRSDANEITAGKIDATQIRVSAVPKNIVVYVSSSWRRLESKKKDQIWKTQLEFAGFSYICPEKDSVTLLMRCDAYLEGKSKLRDIVGEIDVYVPKPLSFSTVQELIDFPWKKQYGEFRNITNKMYHTHVRKNMDYSPANILGTGEIGLVTRLWDKMARLMNLVGIKMEVEFKGIEKPKEAKNESIEDTFMDGAVYNVIGMLLRKGVWGK